MHSNNARDLPRTYHDRTSPLVRAATMCTTSPTSSRRTCTAFTHPGPHLPHAHCGLVCLQDRRHYLCILVVRSWNLLPDAGVHDTDGQVSCLPHSPAFTRSSWHALAIGASSALHRCHDSDTMG